MLVISFRIKNAYKGNNFLLNTNHNPVKNVPRNKAIFYFMMIIENFSVTLHVFKTSISTSA